MDTSPGGCISSGYPLSKPGTRISLWRTISKNFWPLDFSYSEPEELVELLKNPKKLDELYSR